MAAALVTAALLSFGGLVASLILGMTISSSPDVLRHTTTSIFATLLTLLTHSMMMFYFIGKGKAVREAVTEAASAATSSRASPLRDGLSFRWRRSR